MSSTFSLADYELAKMKVKQLQKTAARELAAGNDMHDNHAPSSSSSVPASSLSSSTSSTYPPASSSTIKSSAARSTKAAAAAISDIARFSITPALSSSSTIPSSSSSANRSPLRVEVHSAKDDHFTSPKVTTAALPRSLPTSLSNTSPSLLSPRSTELLAALSAVTTPLSASAALMLLPPPQFVPISSSSLSASTSPKMFAPPLITSLVPASGSSVQLLADPLLFARKLEQLSAALLHTASSLGLKYSLDARLKLLLRELESEHASGIKRAEEVCTRVEKDWAIAQQEYELTRARYALCETNAAASLSDRTRALAKSNARSLATAITQAEAALRAAQVEKLAKYDSVTKHNAETLRQHEDAWRLLAKTERAAESAKSRSAESALLLQLQQLEERGGTLLSEKESELHAERGKNLTALETLHAQSAATHQAEAGWDLAVAEREALQVELRAARSESADHKSNTGRVQAALDEHVEKSKDEGRRSAREQDEVIRGNNAAALILRDEQTAHRTLQHSFALASDRHAASLVDNQRAHAREIETLQSRIVTVLKNKDEQINMWRDKATQQQEKIREIEREIGGL